MPNTPERWLQGQIHILVQGDGERFLHLAAVERLSLHRVVRRADGLTARVQAKDGAKLRKVLRGAHCTLRILDRRGLPFLLAFFTRRPILPLMAVCLITALFLVSSLIFRVQVTSMEPLPAGDRQQILEVAAENGLYPGRLISQVDLESCQRQISRAFPELFFVEISRRGVTLEIRVAKRTDISPAQQPLAPGDLVAACDGVITQVLVRKGTPAVQAGDTVVQGQVLIYGWQDPMGAVAADGIVTARVWTEAYAECPTRHQELRPTGASQPLLQLVSSSGAQLTLVGDPDAYPYAQADLTATPVTRWRNMQPTVEVIHGSIGQLTPIPVEHSYEEALAIAERDAELAARSALAALCDISATSILETQVTPVELEPDLARVRVTLEASSEIGLYTPNLRTQDPLPSGPAPE